mmetsp:Transcript_15499/g.34859  ORF Transcript_15499/g.34859 Transcript_15499/m.34859 type:complete len:1179 (+) Transcript_15499:976-4512(+)
MAHLSVFVRTALSTMLYKKALTVSAAGRLQTSTGQVVNMMSNDTAQLQRFLQFMGFFFVAPLQIVIALVMIYQQIGNATWVGVAVMIVLVPVNMIVFTVVNKYRRLAIKHTDSRVKMINEVLNGIRILKFYAWEKPFRKEISNIREEEMQALTKLAYVQAVGFSMILLSVPIIQPILVFLTYIATSDEPLDSARAFTTVALFNIMRFPFAFLPMGFLQYLQARIAFCRLVRYMHLPELGEYVVNGAHPEDTDGTGSISGSVVMKNCSFTWSDLIKYKESTEGTTNKKKVGKKKEKKKSMKKRTKGKSETDAVIEVDAETSSLSDLIILKGVSLKINPGSLVAVIGPVGSGKSSLLSSILGEMEPIGDSKVYLPTNGNERHVSYCAQTPWIVNNTVRENILFSRKFDQSRYDEVVAAAALSDDLAILPAGDATEIGERGINLSGGQKARVALARALYSKEAGLLLLDDPLSAVDSHVGEHLFEECINGPVATGMTRILVTHRVHFLPRCDAVIVMDGGKIVHFGSYDELKEQGVDFGEEENSEGEEEMVPVKGSEEAAVAPLVTIDQKEKARQKEKGKNLITEEEKEEGEVESRAYSRYANAGGSCLFAGFILVQGGGRAFEVLSTFWLAYWAEMEITNDSNYYINVYAFLSMMGVVALTVRSIMMAVHRLRASRTIHAQLTNSVLRAPVAFFDVTPIGRVLNRFAADMDKIDLELTNSLSQGVNTLWQVVGAIGAISMATKGMFLVPLVPLSFMYYKIQKWFRRSSANLQRVTSVTNSPIFTDFSQMLSGTSTIRAYRTEKQFFEQCIKSFNVHNASYTLVQLANNWLGLRLDFLGGFISFFIGAISVGLKGNNFISAGWLGLALSYSIEVTGFLKHGVRMIATIEEQMTSVERVLHYADNIEPEAPETIPDKDPKEGTWPKVGAVEITNASMRYRDGPLVLRDLSVSIQGGEKIGVVGRTGSGKSSLMIVLFRITELSNGIISIDDIDTATVGTNALRSSLSIIPQEPVLFSNTVRYNLDPFYDKTEEELWTVLEKVQLADAIKALPSTLNEPVAEGGENFSQGQRQLICIARALLRKPRILVMDEATASIDNETDALIQKMIRENFREATVLTIAHRLNTIMDSDKILVLDNGKLAEFDTPSVLLDKQDGIFKAMVAKSMVRKSGSSNSLRALTAV